MAAHPALLPNHDGTLTKRQWLVLNGDRQGNGATDLVTRHDPPVPTVNPEAPAERRLCRCGCGNPLTGRPGQVWASETCRRRVRARRETQARREQRTAREARAKGKVAAMADHPSEPVSGPPAASERELPAPCANGSAEHLAQVGVLHLGPFDLAVQLARDLPGARVTIKVAGIRVTVRA
jgi:hypothetical protein